MIREVNIDLFIKGLKQNIAAILVKFFMDYKI